MCRVKYLVISPVMAICNHSPVPAPSPSPPPSPPALRAHPKTEIALGSQDSNSRNQGCRDIAREIFHKRRLESKVWGNPCVWSLLVVVFHVDIYWTEGVWGVGGDGHPDWLVSLWALALPVGLSQSSQWCRREQTHSPCLVRVTVQWGMWALLTTQLNIKTINWGQTIINVSTITTA